MKFSLFVFGGACVNAAVLGSRASYSVKGKPEGFATGVTGGGSAACQVPSSIAQLTTWLTDNVARCIVIDKEFNYKKTQGTATENGCRPTSNKCPGKGGQDAINLNNWCQPKYAGAGVETIKVTYDEAGLYGINVGSNKSIIGVGNKGVIRGRGLRIAKQRNIIIQNIQFTEINPQYIWGGDAIAVDAGSDLIWVDHNKFSLIGRQMFVTGTGAAGRVTFSNNEFDGQTSWSATCDNRHYYAIYLDGSSDKVTMKGNYIHHTSDRSPKVGGNSFVHAVNNYWNSNSGHAFDILPGGKVVAEGNYFNAVVTPLLENKGSFFGSPSTSANTVCKTGLGHVCQINKFVSSGKLGGTDSGFIVDVKGQPVASASAASNNVANTAGVGRI